MSKEYGLDDIVPLKKHKGSTVAEVLEDDPQYLRWAQDIVDWFWLDNEANAELEEVLDE